MQANQATVGDWCERSVVTATRSTPLADAARLMRQGHVGCLVVVDPADGGWRVAGVLTDRDIVTAVLARAVDPAILCAGDVMSEDVATVDEGASLHEAVAQLQARGVRRLPVVAEGDLLVGMISADDVLQVLAEDFHALADALAGQRRLEFATRR